MKITLATSHKVPSRDVCNPDFLQKMVNRCIVGFYRYGPFRFIVHHPKAPLDRLKTCLAKYERTGNREHLVDLANYAMAEFTYPSHPNAHFRPEDQGR